MAKPEWGTKRICQSCSAPFYDLRRDPIACPKCNAPFDPEAVLKSRRGRGVEEAPVAKPKPKPEAAADELAIVGEELIDDEDEDDEILEDASDLGDDDIEVLEPGDDEEEV